MAFTVAELAARIEDLEPRVEGDGGRRVSAVAPLDRAGPDDLAFLTSPRFRAQAAATRAGALVVGARGGDEDGEELETPAPAVLRVSDPELAMVRLLEVLHPPARPATGAHPTAVVDPGATVADDASVGPFAVVGEGSEIGAGATLGAHAVVGRRCRVGAGATLHPHAVLYDDTEVGERAVIHAGVVLGADGFGYIVRGGRLVKVPQVGRTVIGPEVEIGANSAVDRAKLGETRVGAGSKIDNLVQVGHNVEIGRGAILCGQSGVAGSSRLGDGVVLGGKAGVADHLEVGDGVQVGGLGFVARSVEAGRVLAGALPALDIRRWRRRVVLLDRLEELFRRVRTLERPAADEDREEKEET